MYMFIHIHATHIVYMCVYMHIATVKWKQLSQIVVIICSILDLMKTKQK